MTGVIEALWISMAASGLAATPSPPMQVLHDTIVVTAERGPESRDEIAAAVSLLTREDIAPLPAEDLADLLQFLPGVVVLRNAEGARPHLTSRGFYGGGEVEYVQLLVDGIPVGDPRSGLSEWDTISVEVIERVEMLHGPASSLYGDAALGGVVNVITSSVAETAGGSATVQWESFNAIGGTFSWHPGPGIDGGISASASTGDGFREHSEHERLAMTLKFGRTLGSGYLSARGELGSYEREDPGPLPLELLGRSPRSSHDLFRFDGEDSTNIHASLQFSYPGPTPFDLALYAIDRDESLVRTILLAPGFGDRAHRDTASRTFGLSFTTTKSGLLGGRPNELRGGVDAARDEIRTRYFETTDQGARGEALAAGDGERDRIAFFLSDAWSPTPRIRVIAGVRYDSIEDSFGESGSHQAWSPRIGINVRRGNETAPTSFFLNWSRAFRAPTLDQLFDPRPFPDFAGGSFTISNPDLQPQRSTSVELGVSRSSGTLEWSSTVYRSTVDDEIDFDIGTFSYRNIGESIHYGLEAAAYWKGERIQPRLVYTLTRVEPRNGDNRGHQLKNIPEHLIRLGATTRLPAELQFHLSAEWMGGWYLDDANRFRADDAIQLDLRLQRDFRSWSGSVDITNVLDRVEPNIGYVLSGFDGSEVAYAYPSDGRLTRIAISRRF